MFRLKTKNRLFALKIYAREALGTGVTPLVMAATLLVALTLFLTTWHFAIAPEFQVNVSSPAAPIRHAVVTVERLSWLRPGPKSGFVMKQTVVFRVEGQELEYPAKFHANPGEAINVFYVVDRQGRIFVKGITQTE
jgi:hypothetical protein